MEVNGPGSVHSAFPVQSARPPGEARQIAEPKPPAVEDRVEISAAGRMLEQLEQSGQMRAERLLEIKAAIEADRYETPEKLELALERLLAEIGLEEKK